VPYIICIDRAGGGEGGKGAASGKGLAQRAYHIDEVRAPGAQLEVDAAYYLSQQVRRWLSCNMHPCGTISVDLSLCWRHLHALLGRPPGAVTHVHPRETNSTQAISHLS
jgi:hypothetical protein